MSVALRKKIQVVLALFFCMVFFVFLRPVFAGPANYQRCELDSECILGEFLFDDAYNPVTTDVCVIDIRNPDGTVVVDSAHTAFGAVDGWHSYTFSASAPEGFYRAIMCCTANSQMACMDKSFIIGTSFESVKSNTDLIRNATFDFSGVATTGSTDATLVDPDLTQSDDYWVDYKLSMISGGNSGQEKTITDFNSGTHTLSFSAFSEAIIAGDGYVLKREDKLISKIWNATTRTLSSLTNVAGDIWGYSSRTMTAFGSLAQDVWNSVYAPTRRLSDKTLSSGDNIATEAYIDTSTESIILDINSTSATIIDKEDAIQEDVTYIRSKADSIFSDTQYISEKADQILTNINNLPMATVTGDLDEIKARLGTSSDISTVESLFGRAKYLQEKWGTQTADAIINQGSTILGAANDIQTKLGYSGPVSVYDDLNTLKNATSALRGSVGNPDDLSSAETVFGRIKEVKDKLNMLDEIDAKIDDISSSVGVSVSNDTEKKLTEILDQIKEINDQSAISDLDKLLEESDKNSSGIKEIQNKLSQFKALVDINRSLIENKPVIKTYFEWGSVILKMVVANPSLTEQTIDFNAALPKEVKPEYIIAKSDDLNIEYDTEKEKWYASTDIKLDAGKSETKFVEVKDIWIIQDSEIDSLRIQSEDLIKPLEKTAFFAQGTTLKSDISSHLDKINRVQKEESATPEEHIMDYRENMDDLNVIKGDIENLQKLVTDASNKSFLQGNIFGISATSTWAIILMVVVGVALLMALFIVVLVKIRK